MTLAHRTPLDNTPRPTRHTFPDPRIVAVDLWAVVHDRPTAWACDGRLWPLHLRRQRLPSSATASQRLRSPSVRALLAALFPRLTPPRAPGVFWMMDGQPLPIRGISGDRQGRCGRAAGAWPAGPSGTRS